MIEIYYSKCMYVWYTIKFENFSIQQRHQEDALLVAIMTRAWFESRDITDRCDRQLSTIQALCIQPTNTSSFRILDFTFSSLILCFYQTYQKRVFNTGQLWKYFDLNAIWKGWLAIAKLKPLVERYSCQPMRRLDTSNNLSVGPSCMWRTWNQC